MVSLVDGSDFDVFIEYNGSDVSNEEARIVVVEDEEWGWDRWFVEQGTQNRGHNIWAKREKAGIFGHFRRL